MATLRKKQTSLPSLPKDTDEHNDIEVMNSPPAKQKGQKVQLPKLPKPSIVIPSRLPTHTSLQPEKINKDLAKMLGFEANILVTSAEVKRVQAEAKRAKGTLDKLMSELCAFHSHYNL